LLILLSPELVQNLFKVLFNLKGETLNVILV